jgi:hypothetical protein
MSLLTYSMRQRLLVAASKYLLRKPLPRADDQSERKTPCYHLDDENRFCTDLEFRITWVGSAKSEEHDQILDEVCTLRPPLSLVPEQTHRQKSEYV